MKKYYSLPLNIVNDGNKKYLRPRPHYSRVGPFVRSERIVLPLISVQEVHREKQEGESVPRPPCHVYAATISAMGKDKKKKMKTNKNKKSWITKDN